MVDTEMTTSDRIRQLNAIDKDVTSLLAAAGNAIRALTLMSPSSSQEPSLKRSAQEPTIEECKETFVAQSALYFSLVSSIDVNIRRNIYGLEEAGVISAEASAAVTGGLGELDIGWLNSRNDKVGKEMEAELWGKAAELLRGMEEGQGGEEDKAEEIDL